MITLYYCPQTRAARPRWMLEELDLSYQLVRVDLSKAEHKTPAFLKIHPHGAVPAMTDGDVTIFESAAICAYLADKFPEKGMMPPAGSRERALYHQWMFYSVVTLDPPVVNYWLHTARLAPDKRSAAIAEESQRQFALCAQVLSEALEGKPYLLGDRFTAPDVLVGSLLQFATASKLPVNYPILEAYVKRLTSRLAFQRAQQD